MLDFSIHNLLKIYVVVSCVCFGRWLSLVRAPKIIEPFLILLQIVLVLGAWGILDQGIKVRLWRKSHTSNNPKKNNNLGILISSFGYELEELVTPHV